MSKILTVKNLTVVLEQKTILESLNFDLEQGEGLAVIGPNGSGKTVLLKTLLGLYPYEGDIAWMPMVKIGYVPQKIEIERRLPLNLQDLLLAKIKITKVSRDEIKEVLEAVQLPVEALNLPIGNLSGGQLQRALVAFAILGHPNVLLLDEPTASIDQPREEQIYETIHRLQKQYQLTVILVSHDLSMVYRYADRVLCLNRQGICLGRPQDALNPEVLAKLYGAPQAFYHHLH